MANQHHHNHSKEAAGHSDHAGRANIEESDVSFPLVVFFFVISGLLVIFSGGIAYGLWTYLASQADQTARSEYTLASKKRKEIMQKYPERDPNGYYYKKLENTLPPYPRLEGITAAAILSDPNFKADPNKVTDLDHVIMSGNLGWPSEGGIQRELQEKMLSKTGKDMKSINEVMKDLAGGLPVRDSKINKRLLDYYERVGAASSGRSSSAPETAEGEKP